MCVCTGMCVLTCMYWQLSVYICAYWHMCMNVTLSSSISMLSTVDEKGPLSVS